MKKFGKIWNNLMASLVPRGLRLVTFSLFLTPCSLLLIPYSLLLTPYSSFSQTITKSMSEKVPGKFSDYEILGHNDWGTIVHYYGAVDHQFALFDNNLRVQIRRDLPLDDKNITITDIIVQSANVQLFYTQQVNNVLYFKMRGLDENLYLKNNIRLIDSIVVSGEDRQKYYVKSSPDRSKFVAFTILKRKENVYVRFIILNQNLEVIGRNLFTSTSPEETSVKSVKVNNNGHVVAVFGHKSRWPNDEYEFERYSVLLFNRETKTISETSIAKPDLLFKSLITEVSNTKDLVYLALSYKHTSNREDIGYYVQALDFRTSAVVLDQKLPMSEGDVMMSKTFDFKNWQDKASIIKPKRILPRSDGGFVLVGEGEFKYTRIDRVQPLSYNYTYMPDPGVRYTDQNHYYDIFMLSVNRDGTIDWKADMPKSQISENDDGYYSSFTCLEANNVLKFFYNEDIMTTGNFVEYNVNPAGKTKRVSLLNSEKEDVVLVPQKGRQIDGRSVIIPSEQKRVLQLVKFTY